MPVVKLTQTMLLNIERPESGKTTRLMDSEVRGLCADVGRLSIRFFFRREIGGRTKPVKLGEFPAMTVMQARAEANAKIALLASGKPISAAKRKSVPTLREAVEAYISFRLSTGRKIKESTAKDMRQRLSHILSKWGDWPITQITRHDVSSRHLEITQNSGPVAANGCMRYLSAVLNWASEHYATDDETPLLAGNPVRALHVRRQWNAEPRIQTFIPADKLPAYWAAVMEIPVKAKIRHHQAEVVRDFFLFQLFVGMRPGEARRLRVENVDLGRKVFVLQDSKTHVDFWIPFCSFIGTLLERRIRHAADVGSDFVFPSAAHHGNTPTLNTRHWSAEISAAIGGFVPNDMRRTFATLAAGMNPPIGHTTLKRLLNHKTVVADGTDVTSGYIGTDVDRLRPVVERISAEILRKCGQGRQAKVVKLMA